MLFLLTLNVVLTKTSRIKTITMIIKFTERNRNINTIMTMRINRIVTGLLLTRFE